MVIHSVGRRSVRMALLLAVALFAIAPAARAAAPPPAEQMDGWGRLGGYAGCAVGVYVALASGFSWGLGNALVSCGFLLQTEDS